MSQKAIDLLDFTKVYYRYAENLKRNVFQIISQSSREDSIMRDIYWWNSLEKMTIIGNDECWVEDFIGIKGIHPVTEEDEKLIMTALFSMQNIEDRRRH